jgi:predicted acyl esterase
LKPGVPVELDVEIWPTSIVVPAGYRIALTIRGKDYEHACRGGKLSNFKNELRGCGPFLHNDPTDRPPNIFAGRTTLHSEKDRQPCLLLPVIPQNSGTGLKPVGFLLGSDAVQNPRETRTD